MKIKVIIFGASGMVGRGVLLECLDSDYVESVLIVNRESIGIEHEKLKEVIHKEFLDYSSIEEDLKGYNACFWTLGISAIGISEDKYRQITYNFTLKAAELLVRLNPGSTFCYVSGAGTDSTEKGRSMWARVKGKTENAIMALPFKASFMFRPGYIQPMRGVKSKTGWYNTLYVLFKWIYPLVNAVSPNSVTTSVAIGKSMILCALNGKENKVLYSKDFNLMTRN